MVLINPIKNRVWRGDIPGIAVRGTAKAGRARNLGANVFCAPAAASFIKPGTDPWRLPGAEEAMVDPFSSVLLCCPDHRLCDILK